MIDDHLKRKIALIANTQAIESLSDLERSALAYSIQRAGSFEKLSKKQQELIEVAESELTQYDYRFVLDVDS